MVGRCSLHAGVREEAWAGVVSTVGDCAVCMVRSVWRCGHGVCGVYLHKFICVMIYGFED